MEDDDIKYIVIANLILVTTLFVTTMWIVSDKYNDLNSKIDKLPKRVCHFEENVEKINFSACNEYSCSFPTTMDFPEGSEIICENEIYVSSYKDTSIPFIRTISRELKTCLIKTKKEICEIK